MIFIGLGSNLPFGGLTSPEILAAALRSLEEKGISIRQVSSLYETEPLPKGRDGQPWFSNAAALLETALSPFELLDVLMAVEREYGRVREARWAARTLDLDLLVHGGEILPDLGIWKRLAAMKAVAAASPLELPHPRLHTRRFVLAPMAEIAPHWRHPVLGATAGELLASLPEEEGAIRRVPDAKL